MRIMDLKSVLSELRKLSEIVEGWNATQEIGSLERDLALDKLRTLYEAVRFGTEEEPAAADAVRQEAVPTEIPVSLDLGEVLSIEPLPVAEPELPSLSGSGPEPESGVRAPPGRFARGGARGSFPRLRYRAAETVAESVQDSVPADGQEPAGGVAEPAEIPAEPAAGQTAEAELPVAGLVPDPETPAAEEIPAPESTGNSGAGKEVPAENVRRHPESHGIPGCRFASRVPGASGPQEPTDPGMSPYTGKHPGDARTAIAGARAERALPTRLPERGRILRQRRSRSRRPCSASKRRPSATAINSGYHVALQSRTHGCTADGRKACSGTCRGGRRKTRGRAAAASNRQSGNRQPGTGIRPWRFGSRGSAYVRRG